MTTPGVDVHMIGWGHTRFGRHDGLGIEDLIVTVTREALAHAELDPGEVDEIVLGHFNAGLVPLAFASSLVLQADPGLRFAPATRVENACATGSAAVHHGVRALRAGTAATVLVIGVEKMTGMPAADVGRALLGADYDLAGGVHNPYAHLRKDLGFAFCREVGEHNPMVAWPLRRTDCSPVSDAAAALVLTTGERASLAPRAVRIRGIGQASDLLPRSARDPLELAGARLAWQRALSAAGVGLADLDLVEVHDCFTIAELLLYEVIGLAEPGQRARAIDEGWVQPGGRLPVNPSGGLKAKGHPVGATGGSQHMGGTAVANYAGVLERVR